MHALVVGLVAQLVVAQPPTSASFTLLNPATKPSGRRSTGLVEQPLTMTASRLWALGGYTSTGASTFSTWYYDTAAANWVTVSTTGTPAGRDRHGLGWDPVRARLVMFGGVKANNPFSFSVVNETYAFNPANSTFTALTNSTPAPSARADTGFVWAPTLSKFLVFGGTGSYTATTSKFNELWTLEINTSTNQAIWTQLAPSGTPPSARNAACVVFDTARNRMIVFGGEATGGAVLGDTYQYDVATNAWSTDTTTGTPPSNRSFSACAWDPQLNVVVLYGGYDNSNMLPGTYFYEPVAKSWSTLASTPNPGNLSDGSATYSAVLSKTVIFGGQSATGSYTNNTWTLALVAATNQAPTANAGPDQTVNEAAQVTLNGSASSDPESSPLTYQWTQTAGPAVTLSSATAASPTFTAPTVTAQTTLTFSLVVNDGTNASLSDSVVITVQDSINEPPTANAGPNQSVAAGAAVTLSGSGSDPNGEALTYAWSQIGGTAVTLNGAATASPTFTAPSATSSSTLTFRLAVTDTRMSIATDDVVITVAANVPPVADAGPNQTVNEASAVTLSGAGNDPEGKPLSYQWTQTAGPAVTLSSATAASPTFTAPTVTAQTTLTFSLVVHDGTAPSNADAVNVVVQDSINEPPTANAGPNQSVAAGAAVTLSGSGSDPNGEALTYAWSQIGGTAVTLNGAATASPTFTAPSATSSSTLTFRLTVTDTRMGSATDDVVITVAANVPPVADAGPNQTVNEASTVTLSGAGNDPEGKPLSYQWTQTAGPPVTLSSATAASPTFTAPGVTAQTTLTFSLVVHDGTAPSTPDFADVVVQDSVNEPPTANAGADQNVASGASVTLSGSGTDPNGEALTFGWTQLSGPTVTLSGASAQGPSFTAPVVATVTALTFELTVTDTRAGAATDTVTVNVTANATPVANAGPDQTVPEQAVATLDASASTDPELQALTFSWTQTSGAAVALSGATTATPSFPAPAVTQPVQLTFEVTVGDGVSTATDSVTITVDDTVNEPPVAAAGPDRTVAHGAAVTLDGGMSMDPNGEPLTYAWTQLGGTSVTLATPNAATTTFTATMSNEILGFRLTVTDARGASAFDDVAITVSDAPPVPPTAVALAVPSSGDAPLATMLDGTQSTAAGGHSLVRHRWTAGDGSAPVESPTVMRSYALPGGYNAELLVEDDQALTDTAKVQVSVGRDGVLPPLASLQAAPSTGPAPLDVALSCTCSDPQGLPLTYSWDFGDGTFSADAAPVHAYASAGTYTVRLVVGNGQLATTDSAVVVALGTGGAQPPRARLFATPSSGKAPLSVTFTTSASDPDGVIASRRLTFPDGTTSDGETAERTIEAPGRYTVRLEVTDDDGFVATDAVDVVVSGSDGKPPPRIVSRGGRSARVGEAYVYDADRRVDAVGEGPLEFAIASAEHADGVGIDPETGEVRWTPLRAGVARFVVSVRTRGADAADKELVEVDVEAIAPRSLGVGCGCAASGEAGGAWLFVALGALAIALRRRGATTRPRETVS